MFNDVYDINQIDDFFLATVKNRDRKSWNLFFEFDRVFEMFFLFFLFIGEGNSRQEI